MTIATRHELAHHVGARLGRQSDPCRGGTASGGQRSLCERARCCVSGARRPAAGVRLPFFVLRVITVLVSACANRGATPCLVERW